MLSAHTSESRICDRCKEQAFSSIFVLRIDLVLAMFLYRKFYLICSEDLLYFYREIYLLLTILTLACKYILLVGLRMSSFVVSYCHTPKAL